MRRVFLLTGSQAGAGAATGWLLLGGGREIRRAEWKGGCALASRARRWLLFAAALIYFLRVLVTTFITLTRKMGWGEAVLIGVWVLVIDLLFAVLGGVNPRSLGLFTALGVVLYVIGSYLSTGSELQRKWWKERPENAGRLFTAGLFRFAVPINYFGDGLLFTGYALGTGWAWSLLVPLVMLAGFLFLNIPDPDRPLRALYGAEFAAHARHTRSFVPFIY